MPHADFVMAMMPQATGRKAYPGYGKVGALGWVLTESFSSDLNTLDFGTPVEKMKMIEIPRKPLASFGEPVLDEWLRGSWPPCDQLGIYHRSVLGGAFRGLGNPYLFEVVK